MKIRLDRKFKDMDGGIVKEGQKEIDLGHVCKTALLVSSQEKIEGQEKYDRYVIATKIGEFVECDLSTDEISKIKKLIGEIWNPLIVGQSWDMLEGK